MLTTAAAALLLLTAGQYLWSADGLNPGPTKEPTGREMQRDSRGVHLAVGQEAPDFDLSRLEFQPPGVDGKSIARISQDKVRLSSFRSKLPVFLILSSYT